MMSFPDQNFYSHLSIHPTNNLTSTPNGGTSGQSPKPLQEGLVEDRVRVDRKLCERLVDGSVDNVEGNSPNGYSSDSSYSCSRSSISKTTFGPADSSASGVAGDLTSLAPAANGTGGNANGGTSGPLVQVQLLSPPQLFNLEVLNNSSVT